MTCEITIGYTKTKKILITKAGKNSVKNIIPKPIRESFSDIDLSNDIICLWFFKERSDQMASYVHLKGKQIRYYPNTFLITKEKDIKFVPTKRKYIRTPLIQLDMDIKTYTNIAKRFQK